MANKSTAEKMVEKWTARVEEARKNMLKSNRAVKTSPECSAYHDLLELDIKIFERATWSLNKWQNKVTEEWRERVALS